QLFFENFPHPATVYTRDSFNKFGNFSPDFPLLADYEWNIRALVKYKAKYKYINSVLTTFYTGGISTNENQGENRAAERKKIQSLYFDRIPENYNYNNLPGRIKNKLFNKPLRKVY